MRTRNHYINFLRAGCDRPVNFRDAFGQRRKARRKAGRNCRHLNSAALQRSHCRFHEQMIDAHCANANFQVGDFQFFDQLILYRLTSLGAQSPDSLVGIVARERGQIHAGDGAKQPGQLPIFLHGSPVDQSSSAAFDGAGVYADRFYPFQIERGAAIDLQWTSSKNGNGPRVRGRL